MPKLGQVRIVQDFIVPALNSKTFGEKLRWIQPFEKIFEIFWIHKSGPIWTEKDVDVFISWDKRKGHYKPEVKGYFTSSKQRFRAALHKLCMEGELKEIPTTTKYLKRYKIISDNKQRPRRRNSSLSSSPSSPEPNTIFVNIVTKMEEDEINAPVISIPETAGTSIEDSLQGLQLYDLGNESEKQYYDENRVEHDSEDQNLITSSLNPYLPAMGENFQNLNYVNDTASETYFDWDIFNLEFKTS